MSGSSFELGVDLRFEHVGTMVLDGALLIVDVEYLLPRFRGVTAGKIALGGVEIQVRPGTWQVLVAYPEQSDVDDREVDDEGPKPAFVLFTHDSELEQDLPLGQAEAIAMVRVDSGRITALDPSLREDLDIRRAVLEAPRDQVPCMLTPLATPGGDAPTPGAEPRGALVDLDLTGNFAIYAGVEEPRSTLFLSI